MEWFLGNIERYGVDYDLVGLSYYPWWSGNISVLVETTLRVYERFGRRVIVMETAYPHSPIDASSIPYAEQRWMAWEMSPRGQARFLNHLLGNLSRLPGIYGAVWWEPHYNWRITRWLNGSTGLFTADMEPLPALRVFHRYTDYFECLGADVSTYGYVLTVYGKGDP